MYNRLLNLKLPAEVEIVGFADDAIVVVMADSSEILEIRANNAVERINKWLTGKRFKMAVIKTEALLMTDKISYTKPDIGIDWLRYNWRKPSAI